jgi:bacterioferritin
MAADPRLAGYLARALAHEMGAVQQYLTQATLAGRWGLAEYSARFRSDATEEMEHARRLIERMLELGITPNATQLATVRPGRNLVEMFEVDRALEVAAIALYDEAARYSGRFRDTASQQLFTALRTDEEEHLRDLDVMLGRLQDQERHRARA